MIHTKRSLMKSKKNKEEEAEQGVNYLSQKKWRKHKTLETNHLIYTQHKHTHLKERRRGKLFFPTFFYVLFQNCTKPPKLYPTNIIFIFFLFVWRE